MLEFYTLSLLSGFFEIAPFMIALRADGILAALVMALCYQLGNLAPCPLKLSSTATKWAAALGTVFVAIYAASGFIPSLYAATTLCSAAVQTARASMKTNASKPLKRSLRVIGFGLGFFGFPAALCFAGIAATVLVCRRNFAGTRSAVVFPKLNIVNVAAIVHQTHYFSYCYAIIALAVISAGRIVALALFLTSWVTYVFGARLYPKDRSLWRSFFLGHTMLAAMLISIYFAPSMAVKALLWVLTGLAGTTEFCTVCLASERGGSSEGNTFAENAGHALGVALSTILYAVTGHLLTSVLISATAALGAVTVMAFAANRKHKENGGAPRCKSI